MRFANATIEVRMKFYAVFLFVSMSATGLYAQATPGTAKPATSKPKAATPAKAKRTAPKPGTPAPAAATAPAATAPADGSKVVLTVGNETITAKQFDALIEGLPEQARAQVRGAAKRQFAEQLVRMKLLSAEARKRGLDKKPAVALQMENVLAGAAYNDMASQIKLDEAALKAEYEKRKDQFETVSARHILIKFKGSPIPAQEGKPELTEEEALKKITDLRKQILAGSDFAAIAKAESDDTGSGAQGGDLGTFGHGQMVPEFEKTAFSLPVGEISEPIKTQFGYHIIKVDKRDTKSFEEVRSQLEQSLKPEMAREAVEKLRNNSTVVLDDTYFAAEAAPAPAAAPAGAPPAPAAAPAGAPPAPAAK